MDIVAEWDDMNGARRKYSSDRAYNEMVETITRAIVRLGFSGVLTDSLKTTQLYSIAKSLRRLDSRSTVTDHRYAVSLARYAEQIRSHSTDAANANELIQSNVVKVGVVHSTSHPSIRMISASQEWELRPVGKNRFEIALDKPNAMKGISFALPNGYKTRECVPIVGEKLTLWNPQKRADGHVEIISCPSLLWVRELRLRHIRGQMSLIAPVVHYARELSSGTIDLTSTRLAQLTKFHGNVLAQSPQCSERHVSVTADVSPAVPNSYATVVYSNSVVGETSQCKLVDGDTMRFHLRINACLAHEDPYIWLGHSATTFVRAPLKRERTVVQTKHTLPGATARSTFTVTVSSPYESWFAAGDDVEDEDEIDDFSHDDHECCHQFSSSVALPDADPSDAIGSIVQTYISEEHVGNIFTHVSVLSFFEDVLRHRGTSKELKNRLTDILHHLRFIASQVDHQALAQHDDQSKSIRMLDRITELMTSSMRREGTYDPQSFHENLNALYPMDDLPVVLPYR